MENHSVFLYSKNLKNDPVVQWIEQGTPKA